MQPVQQDNEELVLINIEAAQYVAANIGMHLFVKACRPGRALFVSALLFWGVAALCIQQGLYLTPAGRVTMIWLLLASFASSFAGMLYFGTRQFKRSQPEAYKVLDDMQTRCRAAVQAGAEYNRDYYKATEASGTLPSEQVAAFRERYDQIVAELEAVNAFMKQTEAQPA